MIAIPAPSVPPRIGEAAIRLAGHPRLRGIPRPSRTAWAIALVLPLLAGMSVGGFQALRDLASVRAAHAASSASEDRRVEAYAVSAFLSEMDATAEGAWGSHESRAEGTVVTKGEASARVADRVPNALGYARVRIVADRGVRAVPALTVRANEWQCRRILQRLRSGPAGGALQVARRGETAWSYAWTDIAEREASDAACLDRVDASSVTLRLRP